MNLAPASTARNRFQPYPAYKDSGVEWLGEIPVHWDVKKVKRLCLVRRGASPRPIDDPIYFENEGEYAWVRISDVTASERYLEATAQRLSEIGRLRSIALEPGELFVSIAATVGKPIITKIKCCIHDGFVYFIGLRENREYLYYLFSCGEPYKGLGKLGTQLNLNTDTIGDIHLPVPKQEEQQAIVQHLDRETTRIDTLLRKKERLIELLQEKRTALITRAVTNGLDPNVPMKDSGVNWLGEIPAHWEVKRLGQTMESLMDFRGRTPTKLGMQWGGNIPAISAVNVRDGHLDLSRGVNYGSQALHDRWMAQGPTRRGDVLFTTEAPLGNVALVPDDLQYILSQRVVLLRPYSTELMTEYLQRLLICSAFRQGVELQATGSTAEGVKRRYLMATSICVPPLAEQRAVASFLDRGTARLNALIAKVREAIDRLEELRTALISAAVTGKIDVRGEV